MSELSNYYFTPVSEDALREMSDHDLAEWVQANWSYFRSEFEGFYNGLSAELRDRIELLDEGSSSGFSGRDAAATDRWDGAVASDWSMEVVPAAESEYDPVVSYDLTVEPAGLGDEWDPRQFDDEFEWDVEGDWNQQAGEWDGVSRPSWDLDSDDEDYERRVARGVAESHAAVDWSQVDAVNHIVVAAMVSKTASDDAKTVEFAVGGGYVLLGRGDRHPEEASETVGWAALQLGKTWAHGHVRFKRNRLSPNEFVITDVNGDLDDEFLAAVLKAHIQDASIYQYPDAARVKVHRG